MQRHRSSQDNVENISLGWDLDVATATWEEAEEEEEEKEEKKKKKKKKKEIGSLTVNLGMINSWLLYEEVFSTASYLSW